MLKSAQIYNFQSHKGSELIFAPGVNVIVGASDSGKTAIIRALRWVIENRPTGEAFRSYWGGDTRVIVDLDGVEIQRIRGKANQYVLIDHTNGYDQEFVAFGNDVPDEILKALNITQTNTQFQLDQPFLLSRTPGEVAGHFNKIARIDQIDSGMQRINSALLELKRGIQSTILDIKSGKETISKYEDLPKLEANVEVIEEMHQHYVSLVIKQNKLTRQWEAIQRVKVKIDQLVPVTNLEGDLLICEKLQSNLEDTQLQLRKLSRILDSLETVDGLLTQEHSVEEINTKLEHLTNEWDALQLEIARLEKLTKMNRLIWEKDLDIRGLAGQLDSMIIELSESMPDVCPLCKQEIKHKH